MNQYYRSLDTCRGIIQRPKPFTGINSNQIETSYSCDKWSHEEKHFIMWSGGCDSTLLLYELLDAYGGDNVVAVSYKYPWLYDMKYDNERAYRDLFKAKMKVKGGKYWPFTHIEMNVDVKNINGWVRTEPSGLAQACSWLLSMPTFIPSRSYVYEGCIKNDQLTMFVEDYRRLFTSVCNIMDKELVLRQPYMYLTKDQVLAKLLHYDIYDCTWHCEIPNAIGKRCEMCEPCRLHKSMLMYLSTGVYDPRFDKCKNISMMAKKILNDMDKSDASDIDPSQDKEITIEDERDSEKCMNDTMTSSDIHAQVDPNP